MQVISKSGLKLTLAISGTQEEPVIILEPVAGKPAVKGTCVIAASQKRTVSGVPAKADSLYVEAARGFIQLDLAPVYEAIAALPAKIYMARKTNEIVDLDGDRCPITKWSFEKLLISPKTGDVIDKDAMDRFLNTKNLSEIKISEACQMWADEMETDEKIAARKIRRAEVHAAMSWQESMEEMENGHALPEERDPTPEYPREGQ